MSSKLPPCTACGAPATLTTNESAIAMYARHGRTPPQVCDSCAWERVAAVADSTTTADYDKPPPKAQRERATHTTIGGRGVVGRLKP